jgi:hypothetical protein
MITIVLLGAILFYLFVYLLFTHYARGEVIAVISLDRWKPIDVRLSSSAALSALGWLLVAAMVYLVLDYGFALVRQNRRRRSGTR